MSKVFAHRGFSGNYPENTMLAYEKAVEAGCDGIEMDIHLSKDGHVVIMLDADLSRTTNGSGRIQDYTVAQLKGAGCRRGIRRKIRYSTDSHLGGVSGLHPLDRRDNQH